MKKRKKKHLKTNTPRDRQQSSGFTNSISICDSANADKAVGKLTKSFSSPCALQHFSQPNVEDFEEEDEEEDDEGRCDFKKERRKRKEVQSIPNCFHEGETYCFDFWETLSMYLHPESVNVYARLCKAAHLSVNRVSFWLNLYRRYVIWPMNSKSATFMLPLGLQPDYINAYCRGNLRLKVIKALFYSYEPLRDRLCQFKFKLDPHQIVGMIVHSAWTARKSERNFKFCLKLCMRQCMNHYSSVALTNEIDDWENLGTATPLTDISQSPEESCLLLQLDCDAFSLLPGALPGLRIFDFNVISSGDGFRYQKVTLTLGPSHQRSEKDFKGRRSILSPHSITLTIGNILAIHLWPWYHPLYSC